MNAKRVVFVLFLLFCLVYYIARLAVFAASQSGGVEFERQVSELAEGVVSYSFLGIGVIGLLLLPGIVLHKPWGFWGTILLSAYTIAWDVWAAIWVQSSAAIGIFPAVVIMAYLLLTRGEYAGKERPAQPVPVSPGTQ